MAALYSYFSDFRCKDLGRAEKPVPAGRPGRKRLNRIDRERENHLFSAFEDYGEKWDIGCSKEWKPVLSEEKIPGIIPLKGG